MEATNPIQDSSPPPSPKVAQFPQDAPTSDSATLSLERHRRTHEMSDDTEEEVSQLHFKPFLLFFYPNKHISYTNLLLYYVSALLMVSGVL